MSVLAERALLGRLSKSHGGEGVSSKHSIMSKKKKDEKGAQILRKKKLRGNGSCGAVAGTATRKKLLKETSKRTGTKKGDRSL